MPSPVRSDSTWAPTAAWPPTMSTPAGRSATRASWVCDDNPLVAVSSRGVARSAAHAPAAKLSANPRVGSVWSPKARVRTRRSASSNAPTSVAVSSRVWPAVRVTSKPASRRSWATASLTAAVPPRIRTLETPSRRSSSSTPASSCAGSPRRSGRPVCSPPEARASAKSSSLASRASVATPSP